jgi:hypothetical protein
MKKIVLILVSMCIVSNTFSQVTEKMKTGFPEFNLGAGIGMDYGGIGGRITLVASPRFEFFGAIGYNLLGVGFNGGVDLRILPQSHFCPFVGAMYGYNAVIKVEGASQYNKTYYGPSFAAGLEIWGRNRPNFFNIELILPVRSSAFHDDYDNLKNNSGIVFKNDIFPVAFSIGYHVTL